MARTLDPEAHALRRDAFIDSAERLIQVTSYEQLSIQAVLDDLDASRGAFYHYFDSKEALLDAVIERMADSAMVALTGIVDDPNLLAADKLHRVFTTIAQWKSERKELVIGILRVWLSDDNAIVREKFRRGIVVRLAPLLARIVRQGQLEGTFTASAADHTARVLVSLVQGANETAVDLFVARQAGTVSMEIVQGTFAAYGEAFERVLGLPPGSFPIIDAPTMRLWFG